MQSWGEARMSDQDQGKDLPSAVAGGNVFADLDLEDAPELRLRSVIAGHINFVLSRRHLTEQAAADLLAVSLPRISALRDGKLRDFSLEELVCYAVRLGCEVDIGIRQTSPPEPAGLFVRLENGQRVSLAV